MMPLPFTTWAKPLRWLDGRPLLATIEPYRLRNFTAFLDDQRYNVGLFGRAKKNWKSADAMIAALRAVSEDRPAGSQVYVLANDRDQARDDLVLLEKIVRVNPLLEARLTIRRNVIERKDAAASSKCCRRRTSPARTARRSGSSSSTRSTATKSWDLFEALAFDPTRPEAQWWITSYASLFHRPGVPLFDLMAIGKAGTDPRMWFSWYGADFTTDPAFADVDPDARANPSRESWGNDKYLVQQRRLLPAHKFRRLHLNLPGLPEGSAFQAEPVMDAIARGVTVRTPQAGVRYAGFVDMSGGSNDDAVLAIAHQDVDGKVILDTVLNQGPPPPFDPRHAVTRFVAVLREYRCSSVTGDRYAGETFRCDFENAGIAYRISDAPSQKSTRQPSRC
jgi:hypothetical protein